MARLLAVNMTQVFLSGNPGLLPRYQLLQDTFWSMLQKVELHMANNLNSN